MNLLKKYWQILLGFFGAIFSVLAFRKSSQDQANDIKSEHDEELKVLKEELNELEKEAIKHEVALEKKVEVKDLDEEEVKKYWENELKEE